MVDVKDSPDVVHLGLLVSDLLARLPEGSVHDIGGTPSVVLPVGGLSLVSDMKVYSGGNVPNSGIPME
jgi:hypothetical protein